MLLQQSSLEVMKAQLRVLASEEGRLGWRRAMLWRRKKDVLVAIDLKERAGSVMMPRFFRQERLNAYRCRGRSCRWRGEGNLG